MDINRLPSDFVDNMRDLLGDDVENYLSHMANGTPRKGLRVNTLKVDTETFEEIFPYELVRSDFSPLGYYLPSATSLGTHPYHHAGLFYMQEPSSMSVVNAISPYIGERVLDMCSAPGGKGTYLASLMMDKGTLVLNEYVRSRASILMSNVERMGIRNATITSNAPKDFARLMPCYFDTIVVDAPCSGEGMFLKEENAIPNWSMKNVEACCARQLDILDASYECLAGGGYMVYSTCTLNRYENEGVVTEFLTRHPDMRLVDVHDSLAKVTDDGVDSVRSARRIFPHRAMGEGHFLCVMTKGGTERNNIEFDSAYTIVRDIDEVAELYSHFSSQPLYGAVGEHNGIGYILPSVVPYKRGINIVRSGTELYSRERRRLEPKHNLVTALRRGEAVNVVDVRADSREVMDYLRGNTLSIDTDFRGYGVLTVDGYPLSIIKAVDGTIKNHYPKGLRNLK